MLLILRRTLQHDMQLLDRVRTLPCICPHHEGPSAWWWPRPRQLSAECRPSLAARLTQQHKTRPVLMAVRKPASVAPPPAAAAATGVPVTAPGAAAPATTTRCVLIAVDPDTQGAIAVASWNQQQHQSNAQPLPRSDGNGDGNGNGSSSDSASTDASERPMVVDMTAISIKVFDMPCALVTLAKKRSKTTGEPVVRRTVDVLTARMLVLQSLRPDAFPDLPSQHQHQHQHQHQASSSNGSGSSNSHATEEEPCCSTSSSSFSSGRASPALPQRNRLLQAFVEAPPIMPSNNSISRATTSYTSGLWHGLLTMGGFQAGNVSARQWKSDLGLLGQDKDSSRRLAAKIFPEMKDVLQLKKHHGRAEALLIAAWAMGMSVDKQTQELTQGPARLCTATDAYGNAVQYSTSGHVPDPGHVPADGCGQQVVYADAHTMLGLKAEKAAAAKELKARRAERRKKGRRGKAKAGGEGESDDGEESE